VPYHNFTDCFQKCVILTNRRVGKITSREVSDYVHCIKYYMGYVYDILKYDIESLNL